MAAAASSARAAGAAALRARPSGCAHGGWRRLSGRAHRLRRTARQSRQPPVGAGYSAPQRPPRCGRGRGRTGGSRILRPGPLRHPRPERGGRGLALVPHVGRRRQRRRARARGWRVEADVKAALSTVRLDDGRRCLFSASVDGARVGVVVARRAPAVPDRPDAVAAPSTRSERRCSQASWRSSTCKTRRHGACSFSPSPTTCACTCDASPPPTAGAATPCRSFCSRDATWGCRSSTPPRLDSTPPTSPRCARRRAAARRVDVSAVAIQGPKRCPLCSSSPAPVSRPSTRHALVRGLRRRRRRARRPRRR